VDVQKERLFVEKMYPGARWKHRVRQMRDEQVLAIFFRSQHDAEEEEPAHEIDPEQEPLFKETHNEVDGVHSTVAE